MRRNTTQYYAYRIRLEKLKQKTWRLKVFAKILLFLAALVTCLGQT